MAIFTEPARCGGVKVSFVGGKVVTKRTSTRVGKGNKKVAPSVGVPPNAQPPEIDIDRINFSAVEVAIRVKNAVPQRGSGNLLVLDFDVIAEHKANPNVRMTLELLSREDADAVLVLDVKGYTISPQDAVLIERDGFHTFRLKGRVRIKG